MTTEIASPVEVPEPVLEQASPVPVTEEEPVLAQDTSKEVEQVESETALSTPVEMPEPVPAPSVPPQIQQYIAQLEQANQEAVQQNETRVLEQVVTRYAGQLEQQQGFTPEQAMYVAQREGQQVYRQYQAERLRQGQINAAFSIAQEHGVDARTLMNLPTPEAMRQAAQQATVQRKTDTRIAALEAENARLKKAAVPAQAWNNAAVGNDGGGLTPDNIDVMYLKDPVRYGAAYRKFLATGQI